MTHSQFLRLNPRAHMPLQHSYSLSSKNDNDPVSQIFDQFCVADTFHGIMDLFEQLCDAGGIYRKDHTIFYQQLKTRLMSWRAQSLWFKLDKRASNIEYKSGTACNKTRVLIIGSGPCGLRVAIEMALLGAKTVVVEKRDSFSRNNVLHLWPFLIQDLKALGAKKFFGKFCAGSIDHISIRTLQCILLKVALLVGVEVHPGVSFEGFLEPQSDAGVENAGWRARTIPSDHPVSEFIFDVCFSADGRRNTMTEFKRKELRGKFAIGITANFINRKTQAEASVEEISGVSFIFNQKFFKDLHEDTGIDLENIVYYKDETHYFVMTAKKQSLLKKGVLIQDHDDLELLLSKANLNLDSLLSYAREAADYSTNHSLPNLDFASNYAGQPDVDVFDFTSMFSAENASRVVERRGHLLLVGLVGDTLLEPFWPTGSGCARGFLGAMDGAWMVRSWASGRMSPLEVIAERESIYQLLSQTKSDNLSRNYAQYTIDPNTRYTNLQMHTYKPYQAESLYDGSGDAIKVIRLHKRKNLRYDYLNQKWNLLRWFQKELEPYENLVTVVDFSKSWQSGLALCALIHHHWPHLVDLSALNPTDVEYNNQLAFDILKEHCKILPPTTEQIMAQAKKIPDERIMINYLVLVQEYFKRKNRESRKAKAALNSKKSSHSVGCLNEIALDPSSSAENVEKNEKMKDDVTSAKSNQFLPDDGVVRTLKRVHDSETGKNAVNVKTLKSSELEDIFCRPCRDDITEISSSNWKQTRVSALARDLVLKFKGEYVNIDDKKPIAKPVSPERQHLRDICCFCKEQVFVTERCIAEGQLFHRQCFRCQYCHSHLDVSSYSIQKNDEGSDIFCHSRCHETEMRRKDNPMRQFNSRSSWVIAPVDRATFESTRKILLRQSQMKKNSGSKSQRASNSADRMNFIGTSGYDDDFKSSTEQELCFSDDSDSEKPDLSWDEYMKSAIKKTGLSNGVEDLPANRQLAERAMERREADRGGSDADWETDTFSSDRDASSSDDGSSDDGRRIARMPEKTIESIGLDTSVKDVSQDKNLKQEQDSRLRNRMAFFGTVAEPVRINARQFLGLEPQIAADGAFQKQKEEVTEDSQRESAETAETGINQNDNEDEKQEFVETKKSEAASVEISKKYLKEKKKKHKKKNLRKARKRANEKKPDERSSETAIASSAVAAERQTVAVVPLSEESSGSGDSGDEDRARASLERGYEPLKDISQQEGVVEEQTESSVESSCVVSVASNDFESCKDTLDSNVSAAAGDANIEPVAAAVDAQCSDPETKTQRPGLLVAEAMFRSYEETTAVVTSTSGSENCFDSDDDKTRLLPLDKDDSDGEDVGRQLEVPYQRLVLSYSEKEANISEVGNCRRQRSRSVGLLYEQSTCRQTDKVGRKTDESESVLVNPEDNSDLVDDSLAPLIPTHDDIISSKTTETTETTETTDSCLPRIETLIQEEVQALKSQELASFVGFDLPFIDNRADNSEDCLILGTNNNNGEKQSVCGDFGETTREKEMLTKEDSGKKSAPRAKTESLSDDDDDDGELCNRLSQGTPLEQSDDAYTRLHAGSENVKKDLGPLPLSSSNDEKCVEGGMQIDRIDPIDPLSRLDRLLQSLSSKSGLVNESAVGNSSLLSLNSAFAAKQEDNIDMLSEQPMLSDVSVKCENAKDNVSGKIVINEASVVDENVNYIRPSAVSLPENAVNLESTSVISNKCLCMNENKTVNRETSESVASGNGQILTECDGNVADKKKPGSKFPIGDAGFADKTICAPSPVNLLDAKRRFFQEVAQPVRLNPLTIFRSDLPSTQNCVSEDKVLDGTVSPKGCNSGSLVDSGSMSDEQKSLVDTGSMCVEEKEEVTSRLPPTAEQSSLNRSNKTAVWLPTDVSKLVKLGKRSSLSFSEITRQSLPSSVLTSSEGASISADRRHSAVGRCASLPNVSLLRAADENRRSLSHVLAENLRLDHQNFMKTLDKLKAGSSSITEFRNAEAGGAKKSQKHSISSEIPLCVDELTVLENQSSA